MTIGKIYYLSTILGNLYNFLMLAKIALVMTIVLSGVCYVCLMFAPYAVPELQLSKKFIKWSAIMLVCATAISLFVPSKEDFLIITMTKNYTPEQVYTMTKEEIKDSIDYFINQIKELNNESNE